MNDINLSQNLKNKRDAEYRRNQGRVERRIIESDDGSVNVGGNDSGLLRAVTSLNGLQDDISLVEGDNVTIEVVNNELVISSNIEQGGGLTEIPQATDMELGGIRASERLDEDIEVKIDKATGKLYVPTPDMSNLPIPDIHGLPPGGKTGQILMKVDNTDYNVVWVDPPTSGGSSTLSQIDFFKISDVKIIESLTLTNIDVPKEV